jgi:hydroxymethylpyrimidine pyrophosphatase-like HAD family hydrolase
MVTKRKISLVLADVDGTLVNEEKVLTKRAKSAVTELRRAGIRFAITSGRPPLGMAMLFTRSSSTRRLLALTAGSS